LRLQARWPADEVASAAQAHALSRIASTPLMPTGDGTYAYPVRRHERLLGALVVRKPQQERLTPAEDALLRDIAAAAWLVLDHAQLAGELAASRQRLIAAQHAERRKVERDLHDGAQQRLLELALTLGGARTQAERGDAREAVVALDTAEVQLRAALAELRELARGIHPEILSSRGLVPALQSLAERAPLPVTLEIHTSERVQPHIEATAYFVVAEALTNAIKHAHADSVTISVALCDGTLRLAVLDDGVGGSDPSGPGLRGLADRVAAVDGRFEVMTAPRGGTCVRAEVPCASS
jgi:signal transduction histidine kinase